jgi:hypothetical protein
MNALPHPGAPLERTRLRLLLALMIGAFMARIIMHCDEFVKLSR